MSELTVHGDSPVEETVAYAGLIPGDPVRHVWMQYTTYADLVGAEVRTGQMECCGCHKQTAVSEMWSTMPVDAKNLICGAGYLFCPACRFGEDAAHAYGHADADWKQRRANPERQVDVELDAPTVI